MTGERHEETHDVTILTDAQIEYLTGEYGAGWDDETDMSTRGGYTIAKITKRNRRGAGGAIATCGHCGDDLDGSPAEAWAHTKQCEEDNREYQYGR